MAKKRQTKQGFSIQGFDAKAYQRTESYVRAIDSLYNMAISEFASLASRVNVDLNKPFAFSDYPITQAGVQSIVNKFASKMQAVIEKGSRDQWLYACKKNDEFIASIMNTSKISKALLTKMQDRNLDALKTFQSRKVDGLDLSGRVWKYADQFRDTMELSIDVGIGEGRSAQKLAKDLKSNLVNPDKLFRRVRDKRGNLHLSKAAKVYHPGQGVYRSSHKNAMRLTRSLINMAYKESDQLRWQNLEFVVGFEVRLSNNHTLNGKPFKDICDRLVGRYPKNFKFKGWHPQCRCVIVPILQDPDEFDKQELEELRAAIRGTEYKKYSSRNLVKDVPDNFKEWIEENKEKAKGWSSQPYFIRDNFKGGTIEGGLRIVNPTIIAPSARENVESIEKNTVETLQKLSRNMPQELKPGSAYLKGEEYTFDKRFFDLIDPEKPIQLALSKANKGAYYSPSEKKVYIYDAERNEKSAWERKAVVYHEFGHGIDRQRDLRSSQEVADMRAIQIARLKKQGTYKVWERHYDHTKGKYVNEQVERKMSLVAYVDQKLQSISLKIWGIKEDVFMKRGITKADVLEQIGSVRDTIKSLVIRYGDGHSTKYFKMPGKSEAEYLAHAFENAFLGNEVFKKYMPDTYNEMVLYIRNLK